MDVESKIQSVIDINEQIIHSIQAGEFGRLDALTNSRYKGYKALFADNPRSTLLEHSELLNRLQLADQAVNEAMNALQSQLEYQLSGVRQNKKVNDAYMKY